MEFRSYRSLLRVFAVAASVTITSLYPARAQAQSVDNTLQMMLGNVSALEAYVAAVEASTPRSQQGLNNDTALLNNWLREGEAAATQAKQGDVQALQSWNRGYQWLVPHLEADTARLDIQNRIRRDELRLAYRNQASYYANAANALESQARSACYYGYSSHCTWYAQQAVIYRQWQDYYAGAAAQLNSR